MIRLQCYIMESTVDSYEKITTMYIWHSKEWYKYKYKAYAWSSLFFLSYDEHS